MIHFNNLILILHEVEVRVSQAVLPNKRQLRRKRHSVFSSEYSTLFKYKAMCICYFYCKWQHSLINKHVKNVCPMYRFILCSSFLRIWKTRYFLIKYGMSEHAIYQMNKSFYLIITICCLSLTKDYGEFDTFSCL